MSDSTKIALISAGNTFVATFVGVLGTTLTTGSISWTVAFWSALGLTALRAAVKAVIGTFVPVHLGGTKGL